ncbi:MAG TPA: hypothetical protein ENI86_14520 [Acidimicrobiales bacterium]|nr:hypothetical protein [Acidimicrobiales bacterium]
MMLRASSDATGSATDIHDVIADDTDDPVSSALTSLVDAALKHGDLVSARRTVLEVLGPEALVTACSVIGNFEKMNRMADGTGLGLSDDQMAGLADIRSELGFDAFIVE